MTTISLAVPVASLEKVRTESHTDCALCSTSRSDPGRPLGQPCLKGTILTIARTPPTVASRCHARTGGQRKMKWGHRLPAMEMSNTTNRSPSMALLQWGHRLSAMEIRSSHPPSIHPNGASMGHRLSAMEMPWPSPWQSGTQTCFNGATVFRRWRCGQGLQPAGGRLRASMGPPPFGDGDRTPIRRPLRLVHRFNGATAFRRWRS